jgi:ribonucleoside-diphosphate reductase alpha chain
MFLLTRNGYVTFEELAKLDEVEIASTSLMYTKGRVWSNGIKPVCEIIFLETDMTIKCTYDHEFKIADGSTCKAQDLEGKRVECISNMPGLLEVVEVKGIGSREVFDFTEPVSHLGIVSGDGEDGVITRNCGEIYGIPFSACNLCAINVLKYEDYTDELYSDVKLLVRAMDIIVEKSSYPTADFDKIAKATRPLGIGVTNLGALLVTLGMPYGSDRACDFAKTLLQWITYAATSASIDLAKERGAFEYFEGNHEATALAMSSICPSAEQDSVYRDIMKYGVRNSQVTTAQPGGTVSFMLGCDSTGIEPIFALTTYKNLVGGGMMTLIPKVVEEKLAEWGIKYNPATDSIEKIIASLPKDKQEVFWTANEIPVERHIALTAAVQSGISGGVSRTVNLPNNATVEDVEKAYMMAWEQGLKGVTVYRDGSKLWQPLTAKKEEAKVEPIIPISPISASERKVWRRKLPDTRPSITHKFDIGGFEGYITAGLYDDNTLGEVFINASSYGSTFQGLLNSFSKAISMAIQYGVPLDKLVDKFVNTRFEPSGFTRNPQVRSCTSVIDYVFQWLREEFQEEDFIDAADKEYQEAIEVPVSSLVTLGDMCVQCGSPSLIRTGSCKTCTNCGNASSCSG